jgi:hypothetical protein
MRLSAASASDRRGKRNSVPSKCDRMSHPNAQYGADCMQSSRLSRGDVHDDMSLHACKTGDHGAAPDLGSRTQGGWPRNRCACRGCRQQGLASIYSVGQRWRDAARRQSWGHLHMSHCCTWSYHPYASNRGYEQQCSQMRTCQVVHSREAYAIATCLPRICQHITTCVRLDVQAATFEVLQHLLAKVMHTSLARHRPLDGVANRADGLEVSVRKCGIIAHQQCWPLQPLKSICSAALLHCAIFRLELETLLMQMYLGCRLCKHGTCSGARPS